MKKFELKYEDREIHSEVEQYQDFDGLMQQHRSAVYRKRMRRKVIAAVALVVLPGLLVMGYLNKEKLPFLKEKEVKTEQKESSPEVKNLEKPISANKEKKVKGGSDAKMMSKDPEIKSGIKDIGLMRDIKSSPEPVGGYRVLYKYFENAIAYPPASLAENIEGKVRVKLWIGEDGRPDKITIIEGLNKELDREAIRAIKEMPDWKPATINGQPYRSQIILSVQFVIKDKDLR